MTDFFTLPFGTDSLPIPKSCEHKWMLISASPSYLNCTLCQQKITREEEIVKVLQTPVIEDWESYRMIAQRVAEAWYNSSTGGTIEEWCRSNGYQFQDAKPARVNGKETGQMEVHLVDIEKGIESIVYVGSVIDPTDDKDLPF